MPDFNLKVTLLLAWWSRSTLKVAFKKAEAEWVLYVKKYLCILSVVAPGETLEGTSLF